jgi:hypothetical protein
MKTMSQKVWRAIIDVRDSMKDAWHHRITRPVPEICAVRMRELPGHVDIPKGFFDDQDVANRHWKAVQAFMDYMAKAQAPQSLPAHGLNYYPPRNILLQKHAKLMREAVDKFRQSYVSPRPDIFHLHEDLARFTSALETGLPVHLLIPQKKGAWDFFHVVPEGGNREDLFCKPVLWLGMSDAPSFVGYHQWYAEQHRLARRYWEIPAFADFAGRHFVHFDTPIEVAYMMAVMARQGYKEVFLKAASFKKGTWNIDLSHSDGSPESCLALFRENVGEQIWNMPDIEEEMGWLVQEHVEMRNETRVFVVNRQIVGVVPVRREDHVLAPPSDNGVLGRVRSFAKACAEEFRTGFSELEDYVMDIAFNEKDEPILIELNPILSAGMYGFHPRAMVQGMYEAAFTELPKFGP